MTLVIDQYNAEAAGLALRYDTLSFADVHGDIIPFLPKPPARILDVGSGSGRDAIAMAVMGYLVSAVEPSDAMRAHASGRPRSGLVRWINDVLPDLKTLRGNRKAFDFVLCSGVLMHFPIDAVGQCLATMSYLLRSGGFMVVTLRGTGERDMIRPIYTHQASDMERFAERANLEMARSFQSEDKLGRQEVSWTSLVFKKG